MEVYISINGVLRNFIQKFEYHYNEYYLETEVEKNQNLIKKHEDYDLEPGIEENQDIDDGFEYRINYPVKNDNILNHYIFQSKEEYSHFCFIEFPLEIFGHAGLSYSTAISDLNKVIYENKNINFTIVGLDELGKAKPSTLFFLSKNQFFGNNIKFIRSEDIEKEWEKCDMWITDNKEIIDKCPENKTSVKFNTDYNQYFTNKIEINNLTKINELWSTSSEKAISSI